MKLKNIYLVFVLGTIWGLTSCSSEEMIDTPQNGEVTLSFALSVKDDLTKADPIATDDELKINNCHIAVFDDQEGSESKGNLITSFDFPEGDESASLNPNEEGVYTLSQSASIRTWGKSRKVKVLAIANIDGTDNKTTTDFKGCTTNSAYQSAVVTSSSFQSNNLVKVGETTLTLENGEKNATIKIELTQLTARIDYVGIQAEGEETTKASSLSSESSIEGFIMEDQELEGEEMKDLIRKNYSKFQDINGEIGSGAKWMSFTDGVYAFGFYKDNSNGDKDNENYKSRFIGVKFVKTVSSSKSDVTRLTISGINNKSKIVTDEPSKIAYTDESSKIANTVYGDLGEISIDGNTFYTYEYPVNEKHSLILTVNSSNSGQQVAYGFIRQNYESQTKTYSPDVASAISDKNIYIYDLSGNRQNGAKKFDMLTWTSLTTDGDKKFTLDLSEVTFVRGYRYKILGQYKIGVGLQWEVQSMGSEAIEIPSFN